MKRYLYLIVYIGLGLSLAACKQQPKKFVIGVSQCSEDNWRNKLNDELKMGEYLNDSIIVKLASSNDDNVLQNKQVNQFVDEGVDLLVISPNQLSAISKAVERAYEKGIPVILYDRISNTDKYTALQAEGLTIYIYNNNQASWVNHGTWYRIEGQDHGLSKDQIIKMATSL